MQKNWIRLLFTLLVIVLVGMFFYQKVYLPKSTYQTVKAQKSDMNVSVFGIGEVSAKMIYPITAQTAGKILTLTKDQGDWVKKGELIATIDPVDLPQQLESAKISYHKALLQSRASKESFLFFQNGMISVA